MTSVIRPVGRAITPKTIIGYILILSIVLGGGIGLFGEASNGKKIVTFVQSVIIIDKIKKFIGTDETPTSPLNQTNSELPTGGFVEKPLSPYIAVPEIPFGEDAEAIKAYDGLAGIKNSIIVLESTQDECKKKISLMGKAAFYTDICDKAELSYRSMVARGNILYTEVMDNDFLRYTEIADVWNEVNIALGVVDNNQRFILQFYNETL